MTSASAMVRLVWPRAIRTATSRSPPRYQLFDIDVLINRTLIYGCLIVTLGACAKGVDLDTLTADLLGTVQDTVQPTRVSLWIKPP